MPSLELAHSLALALSDSREKILVELAAGDFAGQPLGMFEGVRVTGASLLWGEPYKTGPFLCSRKKRVNPIHIVIAYG